MTPSTECAAVLRTLWRRVDTRDWDGLARLLHEDFAATLCHTGEQFDGPSFVRLNRDYPGRWRAEVEEIVGDGPRAVTRTRVSDGALTFFVASFGEVRDGLLVSLVEVWADGDASPPADRPQP